MRRFPLPLLSLLPLVCVLAVALPTCAAAQSDWERVAEAPLAGVPDVLETRWVATRPPGGPYDRIRVHRYRGEGEASAALLYLPGGNMNGVVAVNDENHNLWIYLARRGVDVYTLDHRMHFIPSSREQDFAFMRSWGLDMLVSDARLAAALARRESGVERLFVGGFSAGVTLSYTLVCAEPPEAIAGLIALDGSFKSHAPKAAFDHAAAVEQIEASGRYAGDVSGSLGWDKRHALMLAAGTDPSGPALDPGFDSVGAQVSDILYNDWGPGALANPRDGVSRVQVLAQLLDGYDRYYPAAFGVDWRSISDHDDDPRTALDDAWGELSLPVLYFGATGMGTRFLLNGIYSAGESGSEDVTLHVLEGYGHLDVLVGENAAREVFEPTLRWIRERSGP